MERMPRFRRPTVLMPRRSVKQTNTAQEDKKNGRHRNGWRALHARLYIEYLLPSISRHLSFSASHQTVFVVAKDHTSAFCESPGCRAEVHPTAPHSIELPLRRRKSPQEDKTFNWNQRTKTKKKKNSTELRDAPPPKGCTCDVCEDAMAQFIDSSMSRVEGKPLPGRGAIRA